MRGQGQRSYKPEKNGPGLTWSTFVFTPGKRAVVAKTPLPFASCCEYRIYSHEYKSRSYLSWHKRKTKEMLYLFASYAYGDVTSNSLFVILVIHSFIHSFIHSCVCLFVFVFSLSAETVSPGKMRFMTLVWGYQQENHAVYWADNVISGKNKLKCVG